MCPHNSICVDCNPHAGFRYGFLFREKTATYIFISFFHSSRHVVPINLSKSIGNEPERTVYDYLSLLRYPKAAYFFATRRVH